MIFERSFEMTFWKKIFTNKIDFKFIWKRFLFINTVVTQIPGTQIPGTFLKKGQHQITQIPGTFPEKSVKSRNINLFSCYFAKK